MDLLDCDASLLYFDEPLAPEVEELVAKAGECYGKEEAEFYVLRAYFLAPEQLVVLTAVYRYYFYQHRLEDACLIADRTLLAAGGRLGLTADWRSLEPADLEQLGSDATGLLRFYLLALKASAYLHFRLGNSQEGHARLSKLLKLDRHDQLGGQALLALIQIACTSA